MNKSKPNKLLDADTAVSSYLDNLLQEATEDKAKIQVKEKTKVKQAEKRVEKKNVHLLDTPLTALIEDPGVGVESNKQLNSEQKEDNFEFPIQCLMFRVENNILSIPLIRMGSVVPWGGRLTQMPGMSPIFKGVLQHRDKNVKVVDTAKLMGAKVIEAFSPSHLLVFEGGDWAISCDELFDVVKLEESDIKWHDKSLKKLSLGTIKESLAILLNPSAIETKLVKL